MEKGWLIILKNQINSELLAESLANYYAKNPAITFRVAWAAYVNNYIPLSEAAAALGGTFKQFLELGRHYTDEIKTEIPAELLDSASEEQQFLLECLPQRLLNILGQLLVKDILLPSSQRYVGSLWEDLRFLKKLRFVKQSQHNNLYRFSLSLDKTKSGKE